MRPIMLEAYKAVVPSRENMARAARLGLAVSSLAGLTGLAIETSAPALADSPPVPPGQTNPSPVGAQSAEWTFGVYEDATLDPTLTADQIDQKVDQIAGFVGPGGRLKIDIEAVPGKWGQRDLPELLKAPLVETLKRAKADGLTTAIMFMPWSGRFDSAGPDGSDRLGQLKHTSVYHFTGEPNQVKAFVQFEVFTADYLKLNGVTVDEYEVGGNEPNNPDFQIYQYDFLKGKFVDRAAIISEELAWKSIKALSIASPESEFGWGNLYPIGTGPTAKRQAVPPVQFEKDFLASYLEKRHKGLRRGPFPYYIILVHPYIPKGATPDFSYKNKLFVGPNDSQRLVNAMIDEHIPGVDPAQIKVSFDEFGIQSGPNGTSEQEQGREMVKIIQNAFCRRRGVIEFKYEDSDGWTTGVVHAGAQAGDFGTPKPAEQMIEKELVKIRSGQVGQAACAAALSHGRVHHIQHRG